ncbi:MAG TPA: nuclear transport factor 2 family protein [Acidimicrobiales bacterium]
MTGNDQTLEARIARIEDLEEIKLLKARYCRCVDTKDWAGYRALMVDDYSLESDGGLHEGADAVVEFVVAALGNATTVHQVHTPEIAFTDEDHATGTWAMEDMVIIPGDNGEFRLHGMGHYHEHYVRTPDGWRLQKTRESRLRVDTDGELPTRVSELAN